MKRRMTLQEVQSVNLEMMKEIHLFCERNDIRYSLAYGSLIGAVRHGGFIPWDDDIDIMMPRPDFEVFSRSFRSEKGFILSSVYDSDTYVNYTRIYDNRTIVKGTAKASVEPVGVWIDVFPIDAIPDGLAERRDQFDRLRNYTALIMRYRRILCNICFRNIKYKLRGCLQMMKLFIENGGIPFSKWHQKVIEICKENTFGETEMCSSLVCVEANLNNRQEVFSTSDFQDYQLVPFEDGHFYIIKAYDRVLTTIFGDYMQIPPEEKRVSHVLKNWTFQWK